MIQFFGELWSELGQFVVYALFIGIGIYCQYRLAMSRRKRLLGKQPKSFRIWLRGVMVYTKE